jgi:hypothetical protein
MQQRLWVLRDNEQACAAEVAFHAKSWNSLRILVSCKSADLLLPAGKVACMRLVDMLKHSELADCIAVQKVVSQLAFDELLKGVSPRKQCLCVC